VNIRGPFVLAVVLGMTALSAQAQLFGGDDDARRAILDLRQRFDVQRKDVDSLRQVLDLVRQELQGLRQELQVSKQESQALRQETQTLRQGLDAARQYTDVAGSETQKGIARAAEDTAVLRRSLLDLQNQIQSVRADLASQRGVNEQLARDLAEAQRRQKDMAQATQDRFQDIVQATEERFRQFEPVKVNVDGLEFFAEPSEKRSFEAAVEVLKKGDFAAAQGVFADFLNRYPQSGYYSSGLFWLGNAQYATKDYKEAMINFRALMTRSPDHVRAPEAALSVANCQIELKDVKGARKTLDDLLKAYPKSEAAPTARDRLARLK
jgi:tol-pal system protein YbgF